MGLAVDSYCQLKSHVTQKLEHKSKHLRIRGHLPAPIINGGGDSL